jgi:hypothetical protein
LPGGIFAFVAIGVEVLHVTVLGDRGSVVDGMEVGAKNRDASRREDLRINPKRKHSVDQKKRYAEP